MTPRKEISFVSGLSNTKQASIVLTRYGLFTRKGLTYPKMRRSIMVVCTELGKYVSTVCTPSNPCSTSISTSMSYPGSAIGLTRSGHQVPLLGSTALHTCCSSTHQEPSLQAASTAAPHYLINEFFSWLSVGGWVNTCIGEKKIQKGNVNEILVNTVALDFLNIF